MQKLLNALIVNPVSGAIGNKGRALIDAIIMEEDKCHIEQLIAATGDDSAVTTNFIMVILGLTLKQKQILKMVEENKKNREIAKALGIAERTIEQHMIDIYRQLKIEGKGLKKRLNLVKLLKIIREG
jgi:DNA-binding CsgD family transcriptional regulator